MDDTDPTYVSFDEGPYKDRVYLVTNLHHLHNPITNNPHHEFRVTDGGNTLENPQGYIVGHYVGQAHQPTH